MTNQHFKESNLPTPLPLIEISGKAESQYFATHYPISADTSHLDLTSLELDIAAFLNHWLTGFAAIAYDNAHNPTTPSRLFNSAFFIDRDFITMGNFDSTSFYSTIGQRYLPFGEYNNYMINAPLTQLLGRTNAYSILFGYESPNPQGIYANIFALKSEKYFFKNNPQPFGYSVGYHAKYHNGNFDLGADYIGNIANSQGIQTAFYTNSLTNNLMMPSVPGLDLHSKLTINKLTVLTEYTKALSRFNNYIYSFNFHGAKPSAFDLQAGYEFKLFGRNSSFALGYGCSQQALGFNLPRQRYIGTFNISIWKHTVASLELQHNINYASHDTASLESKIINSSADHFNNTVTVRYAVYF